MYSVSAEYIEKLKEEVQERRLSGSIGSLTFSDEDVLAGSFSISGKCMSNTNLVYGLCEITTLKVTLFNDFARQIPRTSYKGLVIAPSVSLKVGNTWESVPCGMFTVDEATWSEVGVTLTAYDNMAKFDKAITLNSTYGKAFDLLALACTACAVDLGNTQAQIEAMPNGTEQFAIYPENDMETWRDLLYWVAQTLGGFATCDRQGRLVVRQFGNDTGIELGTNHRFTGIQLSDYVTKYTGISIVNILDDTTSYYGATVDDGLTMNLGSNPLMQDTEELKEARMRHILAELLEFQYTPFTCKMIGDIAFDLGDVIHYDGGVADEDNCCIMAYNYVFNKDYTAKGFGDNPALATARSKADKELSGIKSRTRSNQIEMRMFVNAEEYTLTEDDWQTIESLSFTTIDAASVQFLSEIQLECLSENMSVEVKYMLDLDEIPYHPIDNWSEDDKHLLHLMYFLEVEANRVYTWTVSIKVSGGDAIIARDNARACLTGQGLAAVDKWNGRLGFEEEIGFLPVDTSGYGMLEVAESIDTSVVVPYSAEFTDNIGMLPIDYEGMPIMDMNERISFKDQLKNRTWGEVKRETWGTAKDKYTWG